MTGAAGGVGSSCVRELARLGAHVTLVDIDYVMVNRLADEIGGKSYSFDVLSEDSVKNFVRRSQQNIDSSQVLINAAGRGFVRTVGMMQVTRALARDMGDAPLTVVNVAATVSRSSPQLFGYAATSHAFQRLSEGLSFALKKPNLNVLTVDAAGGLEHATDIIRQMCGESCRTADCSPAVANKAA